MKKEKQIAQTPDEKTYVEMPFIEQLKESILMTTEIPGLMMIWTGMIFWNC